MKAVTYICGGKHVPSARFRIEPIAKGLEQIGWPGDVLYGYGEVDHKLRSGPVRRAYRALSKLRRAYVTATLAVNHPVVLQRLAIPWNAYAEVALARRTPAVFDFDDAVFIRPDGTPSGPRAAAMKQIWHEAQHVVAGNSWLAANVTNARRVSVVPTCIDTSEYKPLGRGWEADRPVRLGWIGTGSNLLHLWHVAPALQALRAERHDFEVVICSDERDERLLSALGATFVKWSANDELAVLRSFDIGLMPLSDNDWCRGKCSFKIIQYMAVGCPSVASAIGFNKDVVRNGEDGYLVDAADWFEPLRDLITDAELRAAMGVRAREQAVRRFDVARAIESYRRILEELE